jgi:hypothetical protein
MAAISATLSLHTQDEKRPNMSLADVNYADFASGSQQEVDKSLLVKFYYKNVQDQRETKAKGRPIFREKTYINIKVPGQRDGAARPASAADKQRFQRHYDAFKARVEIPQEGTPLAEWPLINGSLLEEMSFLNIKTVELLANLNDSMAGSFMGAQNFKAKAKAWLERAKNELTSETLQKVVLEQAAQIKDLAAKLDALQEKLDTAPKRRKSRAKPKTLAPDPADPMLSDDGPLEATGNDLVSSVDQIPLEI